MSGDALSILDTRAGGEEVAAPSVAGLDALDVRAKGGDVPASTQEGPTSSSTVNAFLRVKNALEESKKKNAKYYENGWGTGVPKLAYELGGKVTDATGSPVAGGLTDFAVNAVPSFMQMFKGVASPTNAELSKEALAAQRQSVLAEGKKLGLQVPPTMVNPSFVNTTVESLGGKAATAQAMADANEKIAYQVAQREASLAPGESINAENLELARERLSQPYRDIAGLESVGPLSKPPFSSPAKTLEDLKAARFDAKNQWNFYNKNGNPEILAKAKAASAKADALETQLEAQAADAGRPDLVEKLREARTALAKNYTVERAMKGSSFDPAALSRLESRGNTPLGGDLETIMNMYRDFPTAMRAPQNAGSIGVHQLMPWLGGGTGGSIGALLAGAPGSAAGVAAGYAGGVAVPMLARSAMMSPTYQRLMANIPRDVGTPSILRAIGANPALTQYMSPQQLLGILSQEQQ